MRGLGLQATANGQKYKNDALLTSDSINKTVAANPADFAAWATPPGWLRVGLAALLMVALLSLVLVARLAGEFQQIHRIQPALTEKLFVIPFQAEPPVGVAALRRLLLPCW